MMIFRRGAGPRSALSVVSLLLGILFLGVLLFFSSGSHILLLLLTAVGVLVIFLGFRLMSQMKIAALRMEEEASTRKRTEESLGHFKQLLDITKVGITLSNTEGQILYANEA